MPTPQQVFHTFDQTIRKHQGDIAEKDISMIQKRINSPDISSWLKNIKFNNPINVIELGCSVGHLPVSEIMFGNLDINSWQGYDCDLLAITIANEIKNKFNLENCSFTHSSVSSYNKKFVYCDNSKLLGSTVNKTKQHRYHTKVPNIYYKSIPACDLLLVDIEGEEINIDFSKMQFKYCILETNTKETTRQFLKQYMSTDNKFKILKNHTLSNNKNTFIFKKKLRVL